MDSGAHKFTVPTWTVRVFHVLDDRKELARFDFDEDEAAARDCYSKQCDVARAHGGCVEISKDDERVERVWCAGSRP